MLAARGDLGMPISSTEIGVAVAPDDWSAMSLSRERGTAVKPWCSIGVVMVA